MEDRRNHTVAKVDGFLTVNVQLRIPVSVIFDKERHERCWRNYIDSDRYSLEDYERNQRSYGFWNVLNFSEQLPSLEEFIVPENFKYVDWEKFHTHATGLDAQQIWTGEDLDNLVKIVPVPNVKRVL
mgnify:FL=1|jgi:hypothetical protein